MSAGSSSAGRVLQLAPIGPQADAPLAAECGAIPLWTCDPDWIERHGHEVEVVATSVRRGCDAALVERLPALRAICSWGVGYETIDVAAAAARGIAVSNTPDVLDDCVADFAWGLLLATARRIVVADRYVREGHWTQLGGFPLSTRVSGKRLGILGLGRIGRAIARRGSGFDMEVRYHGRTAKADVPYLYEPTLRDLARWADILIVACQGGPETSRLVDAPVMEALGPTGILVNIGRGSVVDQDALIRALEAGLLGGVGLDVLENEPGAPEALRQSERVVLTPHVGSATADTRGAMERLVVDNVRAALAGKPLLTPVPA
ncbi:2-hydroxyacid dehydrogenase [Enterovirga rhinocerotis]|uniref:Lactate dehydrogenase-like 2-hydroxyacid dehydrogenase n=1 Tax=Enterovirga rhinocerotis TaxID=1339210 RepID=A0A4R7BR89_9HYPH|nr:2-hydroxyacid dehydrogenase [Enterovirga rhinocerotis]TDR88190.1 lactate dehydrogenase-like 2-hydroxyacid dehydrogenase [Enterovirga rhinocerotis]